MRRYGASPVHVLAHALALALAAWAVLQVLDFRGARNVVAWFAAALVLHDLVLLPAYSWLDRLAQRARVRGVPAVNFVRVPAALTALTFLVFFPLILGKSDGNLHYVSGITPSGYLGRWLLLVAGLWLASGLLLAVRLARADKLQHAVGAPRDRHAAPR
jgi:hypothetical protein